VSRARGLAVAAALGACAVRLGAGCTSSDPAAPSAPVPPPPPPSPEPTDAGSDAVAIDAALGCPPAPNFDGGPIVVPQGVRCERYPYELSAPRGVVETSDGTIYVTETLAHRVSRLTDAGFVPVSDAFTSPVGLAEADDGSLLVADEKASAIVRLDPADGGVTPVATNMDFVTYVALGPDRALYASSFTSFDAFGVVKRVDTADGGRTVFAEDVFDPEGLAFEDGGSLLVGELRNPDAGGPGRVLRYPSAGGTRATSTIAADGFDFVFGVATLPGGGFASAEQFLANDGALDRIRLHEPGAQPRDVATGVVRPTGLAATRNGDLLVIESVTVNSGSGWLVRLSGL
jgi:hypothetical protein